MSQYLDHALSLIFLQKFGGTILTFDSLILRPIGSLGSFMARSKENQLETYPMTFTSRHPLIEELLADFARKFRPDSHHSVGRDLMKQTLVDLCKVETMKELVFKECKMAVKLMEVSAFCPVEEEKHWTIFDPKRTKLVMKALERENSLGLKLWNDATKDIQNWGSKDDQTAFYKLAVEKCPLITESIGKNHF